jgi:hypothetical protein
VREHRQPGALLRLPHRREHLPLVVGQHAALLSNLAECAKPLRLRVADQVVGNLIRGLRRDLRRVVPLHVEAAAGDDVHARFRGNALERLEIAIHVGVAAVDDAADAVGAGRLGFRHHQVDIVAVADRHRPSLRFGERLGQRIADGQMLVKEDRPVDRLRRDVLQQRADDGAR